MNVLQIIEKLLAMVPGGIQLTEELLSFLKEIESIFMGGTVTPSPAQQDSIVNTLGKYLARQK